MIKKYIRALISLSFISVLAGAFWAGWSWQGSLCDTVVLENALVVERSKNKQLAADLKREREFRSMLEDIAATRSEERDAAAHTAKTLEQELKDARNQDTPFSKCLDVPLPGSIIERLPINKKPKIPP